MLISILMPVKNAGHYLEACLDSIMNQSMIDWELIAVEDHSDDNSYDILDTYAKQDKRIKLLRNEGNGIIDALRLAYRNSQGVYITRMDADDVMYHHKLELLHDQLVKNGRGSLAVGLVKYISEGELGQGYLSYQNWLNDLTSWRNNFEEIYKECVIPSPAWMLHRDDLDKCGAFDADLYPEDYDLAFRMRNAKFTIAPTPEVVHQWRDYPERSSRTSDHYADNRFMDLKIFHFLKTDLDRSKSLVVWGAGKKGKKIAQLLSENDVAFSWLTNNPNKIGHEIAGKKLLLDTEIDNISDAQVIIAVAQPESRANIISKLQSIEASKRISFYPFC